MDVVRRVRGLVAAPRQTWTEIAAEGDSIHPLLTRYVPALTLPPLVAFLVFELWLGGLGPQMRTVQIAKYGSDGSLIGTGSGVHFSPGGGITAPVLLVLLAVTTLAMYGLILANARRFGAAPDRIAALKLLAYASTPALLGALLSFVPFIGFLFALAGIVGTVMLFRSGAPLLLPPVPGEEVRFGRTIAVRAAMLALALPIVFVLVVFLVGTLVLGPLRP